MKSKTSNATARMSSAGVSARSARISAPPSMQISLQPPQATLRRTLQVENQVPELVSEMCGVQSAHAVDDVRDACAAQRIPIPSDGVAAQEQPCRYS